MNIVGNEMIVWPVQYSFQTVQHSTEDWTEIGENLHNRTQAGGSVGSDCVG